MGYHPPLIFGPVAPENNPPIMPEYYQPSQFNIAAIALGPTTTITTVVPHDYVIGQIVRLVIPQYYGSFAINETQGNVISIPSPTEVVININSTNANPFIPTPVYQSTPAQIMAIGDINNGTINSVVLTQPLGTRGLPQTGVFIPGSFIDVSPAPDNTADILPPTP